MPLSDDDLKRIEEEERARLEIRRRLELETKEATPKDLPAPAASKRGGCLAIGCVTLAITGFLGLAWLSDPMNAPVYEEPAVVRTVAYYIEGGCTRADLTYNNKYGDAEQMSSVRLPYRVEVGEVPPGHLAYLGAQCQDDAYGDIKVALVVSGRVVKMSESSGRFVIATTSGRVD